MELARNAENECEPVTIGFAFISDWLKNWRVFVSQSQASNGQD